MYGGAERLAASEARALNIVSESKRNWGFSNINF